MPKQVTRLSRRSHGQHNLALKAGATKLLETVGQMAS